MPHIHTAHGQHDHTVSAFIIKVTDEEEPKLLLHRHRKLGVYMQFGGHIELDETPWQAITHELLEESGYSLDQMKILQPKERLSKLSGAISHPQPVHYNTHLVRSENEHYHTDVVYAFITSEQPRATLDDRESNDLKLFTSTELQSLPSDEIFDDVREIGQFILDVILHRWDRVSADTI